MVWCWPPGQSDAGAAAVLWLLMLGPPPAAWAVSSSRSVPGGGDGATGRRRSFDSTANPASLPVNGGHTAGTEPPLAVTEVDATDMSPERYTAEFSRDGERIQLN